MKKEFLYPIHSDLFLNGGPIVTPPPFPHIKAHFATYKYGTAWILKSGGQRISYAIFSIYLVMAIVHTVWVVWHKESSEAWDSANELVALAYKSQPREDVLENCGSGIVHMEPLKKIVRVATSVDEEGRMKAELVFVGKDGRGAGGRLVPGEAYE